MAHNFTDDQITELINVFYQLGPNEDGCIRVTSAAEYVLMEDSPTEIVAKVKTTLLELGNSGRLDTEAFIEFMARMQALGLAQIRSVRQKLLQPDSVLETHRDKPPASFPPDTDHLVNSIDDIDIESIWKCIGNPDDNQNTQFNPQLLCQTTAAPATDPIISNASQIKAKQNQHSLGGNKEPKGRGKKLGAKPPQIKHASQPKSGARKVKKMILLLVSRSTNWETLHHEIVTMFKKHWNFIVVVPNDCLEGINRKIVNFPIFSDYNTYSHSRDKGTFLPDHLLKKADRVIVIASEKAFSMISACIPDDLVVSSAIVSLVKRPMIIGDMSGSMMDAHTFGNHLTQVAGTGAVTHIITYPFSLLNTFTVLATWLNLEIEM